MTRAAQIQPHVAIACGGTGGHLFPGLAVADQLVQRGVAVSLLVSAKDVDQNAVKSVRGMEVITLPAVALQSGSRLAFVRGFVQSWRAARKQFRQRRPDAVLAMGGFTSAPPVLAARGVGAKTFLHESNTIPGRANRWLARLVDHAFIGFPQAAARLHARETTVTGTPVRSEFHARDAGACRTALGFDPARPVVLIMGGSQGATGINELVRAALPQLAARLPQAQWLHLAGARDVQQVRDTYANLKLKAVVHPFLQEMGQVLAAATGAVSRAGASSLAELAALRLPSVLVPFPHAADNHQLHNARAFVESGAALLLEQAGALPGRLEALLADLIENQPAREKMRSALGQWHSPRAAEQIAGIILTVMDERVSIAPRGDGTHWENHSINLSAIT
jgi:UDP-N-acetylglucosamine--N-acetylmuramyl-(pentapeptide) pyrophosphoryl-undecaprenol N-acetylglucosamine transferase